MIPRAHGPREYLVVFFYLDVTYPQVTLTYIFYGHPLAGNT